MRQRIMLLAALAALGAVAAGCGGGGSSAANAAAPRGASGPSPHTVDGVTFSQVVTKAGADNTGTYLKVTFTVANGTTGSAAWPGEPYFSGTATSATGQVTDFPPPGGPTGQGLIPPINIGPGQSASVTESSGALAPGTYTIAPYIGSSLRGTAFGPSYNSQLPGDPVTTQTANPVTITVP